MKKIIKAIEKCSDMHLDHNKVLRNINAARRSDSIDKVEAGFDMSLIGFNKDGDILAVSNWDWKIIKIKNAEFETVGKLDQVLRTVRDNPKLLLEEAKAMSVEEIENKLGHKVIIKEMMR